ncbi:MAG: aspartate carbamoyltransferase catalytic subunit [Alphaproteobacteria bacterium]|nr:aspartate carbamoyltransferase catalytic subunit [Alphaproteobacteria bacterium]
MTQHSAQPFEKVNRSAFRNKHLIGIEDLSADEINIILDLADYYADRLDEREFKPNILKNQIVLTLFFEDSTRTRTSFEMAAKRLGADVINMDVRTSSINKGESLLDTIQTLNSMLRPDAVVVRHSEYGAPKFVSSVVDCPVINAGDSWHEHPTQALLDALTIRRRLGSIKDKTIAICGDIAHSRVASSNMILLKKLGANIHIVAPPALMPEKFPTPDIQKFDSMKDGLKGCDVVMMLRNQKERMQAGLIASEEEFFKQYGLTKEKLSYANKGALVMHPGPMNRGVEIADDVADDKDHSLILEQVRNGVPTRMAVMDILMKDRS